MKILLIVGVLLLLSAGCNSADINKSNSKSYINDNLGVGFDYPNDWIVVPNDQENTIMLISPETQKGIDEGRLYPGHANDFYLQYATSINTPGARAGWSVDDKNYNNLKDFLEDDTKISSLIDYKQKTDIDGFPAYEVMIGGSGNVFGIMLERDGIYTLTFGDLVDRSSLNVDQENILESFRFID